MDYCFSAPAVNYLKLIFIIYLVRLSLGQAQLCGDWVELDFPQ